MQTLKIFLLFTLATLIFYLPILSNPQSILQRGNDLQEFYWPVIYYVKQQILENHTFPLWNTMFFSGSPLVSDPQSPLFYLPNLVFLILPMGTAFIVSFLLHTFFAGIGAYLAARYGFSLSSMASVFVGILYMVFPRTSGFLVEGHFGPFTFFTWLPYLILSVLKIIKKPTLAWSLLFATSLAGLFYSFPTMFAMAVLVSFLVLLIAGSAHLIKQKSFQTLLFSAIGAIGVFGLTAIALLPQLEWLPHTTRHLLLASPDVYPKWTSKIEFVKALFPQFFGGSEFANTLDNEKWLASGIFVSLLAIIGFLQVGKKIKLAILLVLSLVALVALNNISPIYSLLLNNEWYVMSRVSTRIWFIVVPVAVFLAGFGFDKLVKAKKTTLGLILVSLAIGELIFLSWMRFQTPVPEHKKYTSSKVVEFIKNDHEQFRVFCVNRCFSQSDVAKYNLETVEGYGTIYQENYYNHFIQLSQVFMDRYSSVLPPFEIYNFREIQPYSPEVGDYNVKYIISPHELKDKNFELVQTVDDYSIFKNKISRGRAYFSNGKNANIVTYSPNYIRIDTTGERTNELVFAEVYSPGWIAKLDGEKEVEIVQTKNKLRKVLLEGDTQFLEMYYSPRSYQLGKSISGLTLLIIVLYFARHVWSKASSLKNLTGRK